MKKMGLGKNIIVQMMNYYIQVNIKMEKEMVKEKNMIKMVN